MYSSQHTVPPAANQGARPTLGSLPQHVPRLIDGMMTPLFSFTVLPEGTPETEVARKRTATSGNIVFFWIGLLNFP